MASCLIYESINNWKFLNEELKVLNNYKNVG